MRPGLPGWRSGGCALLGSAGLLVSIVLAVLDRRQQQADTTVLVGQLATAVLAAEQRARRQLLGSPERTIDVRFEFRPAPAHNAAQADTQGRLSRVATYYRRLRPTRMVITGAPGVGQDRLGRRHLPQRPLPGPDRRAQLDRGRRPNRDPPGDRGASPRLHHRTQLRHRPVARRARSHRPRPERPPRGRAGHTVAAHPRHRRLRTAPPDRRSRARRKI